MSVPIRIPPKQDFIKYTGPMQFSSEVAGSQTFLGSNAPVYTENTSLDDLLKLQELYSSKSSGSIFNPRGRVYSNLNRKLQSQLDKKDPKPPILIFSSIDIVFKHEFFKIKFSFIGFSIGKLINLILNPFN